MIRGGFRNNIAGDEPNNKPDGSTDFSLSDCIITIIMIIILKLLLSLLSLLLTIDRQTRNYRFGFRGRVYHCKTYSEITPSLTEI